MRSATDSYPRDLSAKVAAALRRRNLPLPSPKGLDKLFEILFFTSLKAEELRSTKVSIIALNPAEPDPSPPIRILQDRWSFVSLEPRHDLSVAVLSKLSQATDPRSSSLAIWFEGTRPYVWGLVDQQNEFFDFINYESVSGPERPGLFQAVVTSPGWITVYHEYERLAELRINTIAFRQPDVLRHGPVYDLLVNGIEQYIERVGSRLKQDDPASGLSPQDTAELARTWVQALSRLLLRTKAFRHGGAFLFARKKQDLKIKHSIDYRRIRGALDAIGYFETKAVQSADQLVKLEGSRREFIPFQLHWDSVTAQGELDDGRSELGNAIWFVSLLSRIDGAVLLDFDMSVQGFGVEILTTEAPFAVFRAGDAPASEKTLRSLDYEHYGTRHRSMMRYCAKHPGSVGFVISQDGDVRAIVSDKGRVLLWDDIKLQLEFPSRASRRIAKSSRGEGSTETPRG